MYVKLLKYLFKCLQRYSKAVLRPASKEVSGSRGKKSEGVAAGASALGSGPRLSGARPRTTPPSLLARAAETEGAGSARNKQSNAGKKIKIKKRCQWSY